MPANHPRRCRQSLQLATSFLAVVLVASAFAGPESVPLAAAPKSDETPLLSFFGGALVFDLEERLRFEVRSNNFDFNDAINDDTDDSWLINRFRLGVALKPASWLKLYAQGQDTREWFSARSDVPGVRGFRCVADRGGESEGGDDC